MKIFKNYNNQKVIKKKVKINLKNNHQVKQ